MTTEFPLFSTDKFPDNPQQSTSFTTISNGIRTRVFPANRQVLAVNEQKNAMRKEHGIEVEWDMFSSESKGLCEATGENLIGAYLLQQPEVRQSLKDQYASESEMPRALLHETYLEIRRQPLTLKAIPGQPDPILLDIADVLLKYFPGATSGVILSGPYTGCLVRYDTHTNTSNVVRLCNRTPLYGDTGYLDIMPYGFGRRIYEPHRFSFDERDKKPTLDYYDFYQAFIEDHQIRDTVKGIITIAKLLDKELHPSTFSYTQVLALEHLLDS